MKIEYYYQAIDRQRGLTFDHVSESVELLQTFRAIDIEKGLDVSEIEMIEA